MRMRVFLDAEFTSLSQGAELISLALVAENGRELYLEFEFDRTKASNWVVEYVIPELTEEMVSRTEGRRLIEEWLSHFEEVEIWGDVLAYDWVLFCQLWGGVERLPSNVSHIPMDFATALQVAGLDPSLDRSALAKIRAVKHNALWDARVLRECYRKVFAAGDGNGDGNEKEKETGKEKEKEKKV